MFLCNTHIKILLCHVLQVLQRTLRVDHVKDYRPPDQDDKNVDDVTKIVRAEGVAPQPLPPSGSDDEDVLLPLDGKGTVSRLCIWQALRADLTNYFLVLF